MLNFNNFAYFLAQTKLFLIRFDGWRSAAAASAAAGAFAYYTSS